MGQHARDKIQWRIPANMTHLANVWPMLAHRLRRWPNIGQTLARCVVFVGMVTERLVHPGWFVGLLSSHQYVLSCLYCFCFFCCGFYSTLICCLKDGVYCCPFGWCISAFTHPSDQNSLSVIGLFMIESAQLVRSKGPMSRGTDLLNGWCIVRYLKSNQIIN